MNVVLTSVWWQIDLFYLDDTITFSKSPAEHIKQVRRILRPLHETEVTLRLKKCHFFARTIDYQDHVTRPGRLAPADYTTYEAENIAHVTEQVKICSFPGLCPVFRQFVLKFVLLSRPLKKKFKKNQQKYFDSLDEKKSGTKALLKWALISLPVLVV